MSSLETFMEIRYFQTNPLAVLMSERKNVALALHSMRRSILNFLTLNPTIEIKIKTLMENTMLTKEMIRKKYQEIILQRVLITIGIPIFVYFFLETFCK